MPIARVNQAEAAAVYPNEGPRLTDGTRWDSGGRGFAAQPATNPHPQEASMNLTTTHDPHGGGHPRLIFAIGGQAPANSEQREFELLPGVTPSAVPRTLTCAWMGSGTTTPKAGATPPMSTFT
jgi:hypothetical protein